MAESTFRRKAKWGYKRQISYLSDLRKLGTLDNSRFDSTMTKIYELDTSIARLAGYFIPHCLAPYFLYATTIPIYLIIQV